MRFKYLLLCFLFLLSLTAFSQEAFEYEHFDSTRFSDTQVDSFTASGTFYAPGRVTFAVRVDSIDGTPAGTITLQGSHSPAGAEWHSIASYTIGDSLLNQFVYSIAHDDTLGSYCKYRIYIGSSGTTELDIFPYFTYKQAGGSHGNTNAFEYESFDSTRFTNGAADTFVVTQVLRDAYYTTLGDRVVKASGTVAGTVTYQYAFDPFASSWFDLPATTIHTLTDGPNHAKTGAQSAGLGAVRWRIIVTTTGTQASDHYPYFAAKKIPD